MRGYVRLLALAALLTPPPLFSQPPVPPRLEVPIDCTFGKDCFIQQYMDHDPGPGVRDYACGTQTYQGHEGFDIRLATLADQRRGVRVLAAAAGTVVAVRNDVTDRLLESPDDKGEVKGRECGNGVLISHGGEWQTQYCHLAKGSVVVKPGEIVKSGQVLGLVGLSGQTQFPHLHLTVRKGGAIVDPFAPDAPSRQCGGKQESLWSEAAARVLTYQPAAIINTGFADGAVSEEPLEAGALHRPDSHSAALVLYARAINLVEGDALVLTMWGPDGATIVNHESRPKGSKAQWLAFAGRPLEKGGTWPAGRYRGQVAVWRAGKAIAEQQLSLTIAP